MAQCLKYWARDHKVTPLTTNPTNSNVTLDKGVC